VNLNGNEQMYCADCYWKLQKEYGKKKSCENCGYFEAENCEKNGKKMKPAKVGFNEYFVEAETCRNYSTEKKAESDKKKKELSEEQKEAVALAKKTCRIAVIVPATPMKAIENIALAGQVMPQKSTYFYPKLLSGIVINPLY